MEQRWRVILGFLFDTAARSDHKFHWKICNPHISPLKGNNFTKRSQKNEISGLLQWCISYPTKEKKSAAAKLARLCKAQGIGANDVSPSLIYDLEWRDALFKMSIQKYLTVGNCQIQLFWTILSKFRNIFFYFRFLFYYQRILMIHFDTT